MLPGFSIGSLIGGVLFKKFGGVMTLRIISVFAAFSALIYFVFHIFYFKQFKHKTGKELTNLVFYSI